MRVWRSGLGCVASGVGVDVVLPVGKAPLVDGGIRSVKGEKCTQKKGYAKGVWTFRCDP